MKTADVCVLTSAECRVLLVLYVALYGVMNVGKSDSANDANDADWLFDPSGSTQLSNPIP